MSGAGGQPVRVAIIGGGVGGLTAARALCQGGFAVDLYEQEAELGGLAARCSVDGLDLDRYYHFVCGGDSHLVRLCAELRLPIEWKPTHTSFFYEGKLYPFGSARHLLSFDALSWRQRWRQAMMMLAAYRDRDWRDLDDLSAEDWLIAQVGDRAYRVIWYPLLKVKFGEHYRDISAAWIWHRVHRLLTSRRHVLGPERLGFMPGGAGELIARLAADIRGAGGSIRTQAPVRGIARQPSDRLLIRTASDEQDYDAVVCAIPAPLVHGLLDEQPPGLEAVDYIGVVCMLLLLDRPLTDSFWINTNDSRIAFNGFIEFSNLNPAVANDRHLVYIPHYCHPRDPRFTVPDQALFEEYVESLRLIQPRLHQRRVTYWRVYRDLYAQPICTRGFSRRVPPFSGPWPRLFIAESSQLYPADRNLSGTIALATHVAKLASDALVGRKSGGGAAALGGGVSG